MASKWETLIALEGLATRLPQWWPGSRDRTMERRYSSISLTGSHEGGGTLAGPAMAGQPLTPLVGFVVGQVRGSQEAGNGKVWRF